MILKFFTQGNADIIDITENIEKAVQEDELKNGLVNIFVKGSTAAITTIEADDNLYKDLKETLENLIPIGKNWRHHKTWGDDNGGSHQRASIIGPSLTVPIINKRLYLGTWQKIVLMDFDTSPREREVKITFIKN